MATNSAIAIKFLASNMLCQAISEDAVKQATFKIVITLFPSTKAAK